MNLKILIQRCIPDRIMLKYSYYKRFKKNLDLKNPKTFNEKLQWLKLYDRKDIYTTMVDKYEVKKYVADIIGEDYIIPTIGIYEKWEDIDFNKLPEQFVIKCTHDSGGLVIVKDKKQFDKKSAEEKIKKCLKNNFFYAGREWPYKNVKPRILIEEYLEDEVDKELRDYKFFCFNGIPQMLFIATNRQGNEETCFDFFDMDFNNLGIINGHPNASVSPHKPYNYEKMKELASMLSKDIPHVRVDFYEVNNRVLFGELTFYHWSGFVPFEPNEWDLKMGEMIDLSKVRK